MKNFKISTKNSFILGLIFMLSTSIVRSQSCGIRTSEHDVHEYYSTNLSSVDIRVYWYIVKDDQGNGLNSESMITALIQNVIDEYSSHSINLISTCNNINLNTIENTTLYNSVVSTSSTDLCLFDNHCMNDGLNVFLLDGEASGLSVTPGNLCFAKVSQVDDFNTVVHEIGHCLGLWHTSHGRPYKYYLGIDDGFWECDDSNVDYYDRTFPSCDGTSFAKRIKMELVNGTNGKESGDFVEDTPADIAIVKVNDPVFIEGTCMDINDCGESIRCEDLLDGDKKKDPNCDEYQIDWDNYMRPFITDCQNHFSNGQINRMLAISETFLSYAIVDNIIPLIEMVGCPVSEIDLNSLHLGDVPFNVQLQWSTDSDPSDGVSPIIDSNINTSGTYYAYYYFVNEECYGPHLLW